MTTIKLKQLELLVRLVEAGSFTRAARGLGITKSAASRELKQLEAEVGVRLLNRTTRSLKVTDSGRIYCDRIRVALGWLEHAGNEVSQRGHEPRGPVRMTAPPHLAMHLIGALAKFMREHPMIRVELSFTSNVVDMVQEGYDIAIRVGRMRDSSLIARRVGDETLGLFASEDYVRRRGRPRTPAELEKHDLVLFRSPSGGHVWRDTLSVSRGSREQRVRIQGRLELDEILFVRDAVIAGIGVGIIPLFMSHVAGLVRVMPRYVISATPVYVVSLSRQFTPERVVLLREFLIQQLSAVPWRGLSARRRKQSQLPEIKSADQGAPE
jgi:DNA-binding transcriptional LysR family regulator